jgi:hypothetical protein
VRSYHIPLNGEARDAMARNFARLGHTPLWTCTAVERLGEDDMRVEIEVWARVGSGQQGLGKNVVEERHYRPRGGIGGGKGVPDVEA